MTDVEKKQIFTEDHSLEDYTRLVDRAEEIAKQYHTPFNRQDVLAHPEQNQKSTAGRIVNGQIAADKNKKK